MGIIAKSLVQKQYPINTGGRLSFTGNLPATATDESYLRYYKQVSWLRAAVSVIAQGVAQSQWRLYKTKKDGDREEITGQHDLKTLINRPNPFQSGYDFLYLHQIFDELIGKNFWVKQRDKGNKELWLLPPQYTQPLSDPTEYIRGYHFERAGYIKEFKPEEIIFFVDPDPLEPMLGAGRAQSVGVDIENQSFMSQWNRNFFYWGADAGTVITYPLEANITPDELDRLNEQWNAGHRSYGRAHKAAILTQGASLAHSTIGQRDMDFTGLAKYNRESILGVFGVSYSMVGGTENVIRANAEAQLFNFARWVLTPRLIRIREKLNMFLCSDYGQDLELDFDDPAPENEEMNLNKATKSFQVGIATRNEARAMIDLDPDETEAGDEYYKAPIPSLNFGSTTEDTEEGKVFSDPKVKSFSEDADLECWRAYIKQAESYEPKTIKVLQDIFAKQKTEALESLQNAVDRNHKLIDIEKAKDEYKKGMEPILSAVLLDAVNNGMNLVKPQNPHKQEIPMVLNQQALKWLMTRIAWAAQQTSETTANDLSLVLAEGFSKGESISQIASRITEVFDNCDKVRATRIARTEILSASNIGIQEGYRQVGVGKIRIWAAQDERTCPLCETLHDTIHGIDEGYCPPFHPNCRCLTRPVVEWE